MCVLLRKIKGWFKKHLPQGIVNLYTSCRYMQLSLRGCYYRNKLRRRPRGSKTRMVFIIYSMPSWSSLGPVYKAAKRNPSIEPYILACPDLKAMEGSDAKDAYRQCLKFEPNVIDAYADGHWFDLEGLKPDIVFLQVPYNLAFPEPYRSKNICRYAKVCYIPYGYQMSRYKHLVIGFSYDFLCSVYAVFLANETEACFCKKQIQRFPGSKGIKVFQCGSPRFDICRNREMIPSDKLTFTWLPRWSLETKKNNGTSFFKYKDLLISYFAEHPEYNLIIRPHPGMFPNFIKAGAMTREEVDAFMRILDGIPNISLDQEGDYWKTFDRTHILIADYTSLLVEFFLTGRPIIYCGELEGEFNKETEEMTQHFYSVDSREKLVGYIEYLSAGNDPEKEAREKVCQTFLGDKDYNISEKIIQTCLDM